MITLTREEAKQPETLRLAAVLDAPEEHYPGNFDTPQRANAMLLCLTQEAAAELRRLYASNTDLLNALRDCAAWMEDLRASGDAGNWDWEADEYTRAIDAITEATGEQQ